MKIIKTKIKDLLIVKSKIYRDKRGFFKEVVKKKILNKNFKFDCLSFSKKKTLRGLHIQLKNSQAKLVTVPHGKIFDVVVDVRKNSPTFGKWFSIILDSKKKTMLWVPEGFGHGYLVLSKYAEVIYKCTCKYYPKNQIDILWNDPFINIKWPKKNPILSQKDTLGVELRKIKNLPRWKK